jgi:phage terminase large subunit-like protein
VARSVSSADPVCGFTLDGVRCRKRGSHLCTPRADHAQKFMEELLVHTKGSYARRAFVLAGWQRDEIVRPMFGTVRWSSEHACYVRRYEVAWIEIARKNGKTELLAAMMLYLLIADGEESAEIYGVARDRDQAALCFDVAARMVTLSPILSRRLDIKQVNKRIVDRKTASVYAVIAADAAGALGSNPSGVAADEILAWRDRSMWDAMRTGMGSGARRQPMMVAATTAGNDPGGFAAKMHDEMARIAEDPARAPHVFVYIRNLPKDADVWDEKNWHYPNPALGDFLSMESLRTQALEAKNDPSAENAYRQFRMNQWQAQASRWMPMHLYKSSSGEPWMTPDQRRDELKGRVAYCGLDLAAKFDLTAWCLVVPKDDPDDGCDVQWRFWVPEGALRELDKRNDGRVMPWVKQGWLTVTDGDVIDYQKVYADIGLDAEHFIIVAGGADRWSMMPVIQEIGLRTGLQVDEALVMVEQTYKGMTPGMVELMGLVKEERFLHHGNPVASWCFDNVEVRRAPYDPELIRPDKPERGSTGKRIDAVPAAAMAVEAWRLRGKPKQSIYDTRDVLVL